MSDKPSYLGLLNAVAVAESNAHEYLNAWIAVTPSPEVCAVLSTVAAREGEHGMSFAKRINELGFQVRRKADPEHAKRLDVAGSDCTDLQKMKALGLHRLDSGDKPDIFDGFFRDHSIDIRTGELLGRYIAEERDSARLLRACYEQLKAAAKSSDSATTADDDRLGVLEDKIDTVCRAVEELRQIVCAQSMPAAAK
jgi:Mn-containing catalase